MDTKLEAQARVLMWRNLRGIVKDTTPKPSDPIKDALLILVDASKQIGK